MTSAATDRYYQLHGFICLNERPENHPRGSCKQRGAAQLCDHMKKRGRELGLRAKGMRVQGCSCLDRCELGPVLVLYPEGVWYAPRCTADIDEILERHVLKGEIVDRLRLRATDRHRKHITAPDVDAQGS